MLKVAWRTLFIQAGFSPEAMQTLGLAYALEPAWPYLFHTPAQRQEAVKRHLTPFNTHPYAAAAIVGGILHYEQQYAAGLCAPEEVVRFKRNLMGPLAALGDGFFWLSWRPAAAASGVALVPALGVMAPVAFLLAYNLVHVVARIWLFVAGLRYGSAVVTRLAHLKVSDWSQWLREWSVMAASGTGVWVAFEYGFRTGEVELGAGCMLGGAGALWLAEKKVPPLVLLYGAALLAMLAGILW